MSVAICMYRFNASPWGREADWRTLPTTSSPPTAIAERLDARPVLLHTQYVLRPVQCAEHVGGRMRASFGLVFSWVLLCSCAPAAPPGLPVSATTNSAMTQPALQSVQTGSSFDLGDGWFVTPLRFTSDNKEYTVCRAVRAQSDLPDVELMVYYAGDTSKPNPILSLTVTLPQSLSGPISARSSLFFARIGDGDDALPFDPELTAASSGVALLTTSSDYGPDLGAKFGRVRSVEVVRADQPFVSYRSVVKIAVPRANAVLRALRACERSGISASATRAAYNAAR